MYRQLKDSSTSKGNESVLLCFEIKVINMTASKLEINIQRLLRSTELLSKDDPTSSNWRLERYVRTLEEMLSEFQKSARRPDAETLNEYNRRVEFLRKLVNSQKIDNPAEKVVALQMMSHRISTSDEDICREIHQKTTSKYSLDIRNELFGLDDRDGKEELRARKPGKSTGEDLDTLIKYHQNIQDNVLFDMLVLTRNLKEQNKLANDIINKDIETIQKSIGIADQNLSGLKVESVRLKEHNKRAWRCWMWIPIFVVLIIFIFMVLFMKVTKKRS